MMAETRAKTEEETLKNLAEGHQELQKVVTKLTTQMNVFGQNLQGLRTELNTFRQEFTAKQDAMMSLLTRIAQNNPKISQKQTMATDSWQKQQLVKGDPTVSSSSTPPKSSDSSLPSSSAPVAAAESGLRAAIFGEHGHKQPVHSAPFLPLFTTYASLTSGRNGSANGITECTPEQLPILLDPDEVLVKIEAQPEDGTLVAKSGGVEFAVREGYFCPALSKAVKTRKKGEKVLLTVKPQYGFGNDGKPASKIDGAVPPNATLQITLEWVAWTTGLEVLIRKILNYKSTRKKLYYKSRLCIFLCFGLARPNEEFCDQRQWNRHPGMDRDSYGQFPAQLHREGLPPPPCEYGSNGYVGEAERNYKRPRVDDISSSSFVQDFNKKNSGVSSDNERLWKLIRDHGSIQFGQPEGESNSTQRVSFGFEAEANNFFHESSVHERVQSVIASGDQIDSRNFRTSRMALHSLATRHADTNSLIEADFGRGGGRKISGVAPAKQFIHKNINVYNFSDSDNQQTTSGSIAQFQRNSFTMEVHGDGNQPPLPYAMQHSMHTKHDFPHGTQNINAHRGYYPSGGGTILENAAQMEASRLFMEQPPLPTSPPPPLPGGALSHSNMESRAFPSHSKPSSLFPVSFNTSMVSSSPCLPVHEVNSNKSYFHNNKLSHAAFGFVMEETQFAYQTSSEQFATEGQSFALKNLSSGNPKIVVASQLFMLPHRVTRPDHIVVILRGLPGSEKSYLAKMLRDLEVENGDNAPRIHSMDNYFIIEVEKIEDGEATKSSSSVKAKKKPAVKTVIEYCYEPEMEEAYFLNGMKPNGQARKVFGNIMANTSAASTYTKSGSTSNSNSNLQRVSLLDSILQVALPCGGKLFNPDTLSAAGARVIPEESINNKLTPNLARPIQDVLAFCSGSLPSWCYRMTKTCPFLFPFETRRQYFYSTSFGLSRALYRLQQQQGADGLGIGSEREVRVGRLQRQKENELQRLDQIGVRKEFDILDVFQQRFNLSFQPVVEDSDGDEVKDEESGEPCFSLISNDAGFLDKELAASGSTGKELMHMKMMQVWKWRLTVSQILALLTQVNSQQQCPQYLLRVKALKKPSVEERMVLWLSKIFILEDKDMLNGEDCHGRGLQDGYAAGPLKGNTADPGKLKPNPNMDPQLTCPIC